MAKMLDIDDAYDLFDDITSCEPESREVAFIRPEIQDGENMWSIYDADGTKLAITDDREFAFVMARQNNLTPQSVH